MSLPYRIEETIQYEVIPLPKGHRKNRFRRSFLVAQNKITTGNFMPTVYLAYKTQWRHEIDGFQMRVGSYQRVEGSVTTKTWKRSYSPRPQDIGKYPK